MKYVIIATQKPRNMLSVEYDQILKDHIKPAIENSDIELQERRIFTYGFVAIEIVRTE